MIWVAAVPRAAHIVQLSLDSLHHCVYFNIYGYTSLDAGHRTSALPLFLSATIISARRGSPLNPSFSLPLCHHHLGLTRVTAQASSFSSSLPLSFKLLPATFRLTRVTAQSPPLSSSLPPSSRLDAGHRSVAIPLFVHATIILA